ncbi:MAG TPA: hypothetical protein VND68_09265, partial [Chloroflexia bacterium]|nr:hypothetical protein [Chloroflexia bacterium]
AKNLVLQHLNATFLHVYRLLCAIERGNKGVEDEILRCAQNDKGRFGLIGAALYRSALDSISGLTELPQSSSALKDHLAELNFLADLPFSSYTASPGAK